MVTANSLITDAILQSGIIPQEGGPYGSLPEYMIKHAFILLNDIIRAWGGMSGIIPYNNEPIKFSFVPNQESYTFGLNKSLFLNTQSIIDVITFSFFLDLPTNKVNRNLTRITEAQYANISYRGITNYPSVYLLRDYPQYSEILVQPIPSQSYSATIIAKQRLSPLPEDNIFVDLSVQFPDNFLLCLKYRLMMDICMSYGKDISPDFIERYKKSMADMMGSNKMDLTLQPSQSMNNRRVGYGSYFFGVSGN
jgi:hypothetical protein